jgi:hypothetical protein
VPRSDGAGGTAELKSIVKASDSTFEGPEPGPDERPISPRFTFVVAV